MKIKISKGYFSQVSKKDYKKVLTAGPWFSHTDKKKKAIYAVRNMKKATGEWVQQKMHRFTLGLTDPKILVDHKEGNGLNNTRGNLRIANAMQSQRNRGTQSNNTTGVSGISWNKHAKKFEAHIKVQGKKKHLGVFSSLKEAVTSLVKTKKLVYGNFMRQKQ